ncbi:RHS repeat-associated core domain-containing protein [Streptomyces lonarensis]|uniref:RHS repeat-associated core domain-containing protein n=1 Tax=Streptomyces lonarensis TaxID=700599 RepID=UPI00406BC7C2
MVAAAVVAVAVSALPGTASAADDVAGGSVWGEGGDAAVPPVVVGTTQAPPNERAAPLDPEVREWREARRPGSETEAVAPAEAGEILNWLSDGQGDVPWHQISDIRITDALVARINLSNGNLMLTATDADIAGVGQNLLLDRTYNSLYGPFGNVSDRWWVGGERWLDTFWNGMVVWYDSTGATVQFEMDGEGGFVTPEGYSWDLVEHADYSFTLTDRSSGSKERYDADGNLLEVTDRNGGTITVERTGSSGRDGLVMTEERSGRWVELSREGSDVWEVSDSSGRTGGYTLSGGDLVATTDTAGAVTEFGYDDDGRVTEVRTPEGRVTVFTYDADSRVTSMTRATEFDGDGHTGPTFTYTYSADSPWSAGTTTVTDPLGHATEYEVNAEGEVEEVTDPLGKTRSRTYEAHMVTTATDAMGTGSDDPGNVTAYGWDARNNLTSSELPTGATAALTGYQTIAGADLPGTLTLPDGEESEFSYDTAGNTLSVAVSGEAGGTRSYTYNPADPDCGGFQGQRCTAQDANGETTAFTYDDTGNLVQAAPPGPVEATTYTYDDLGRPVTVTDGRGTETTYTYDDRDRITEVTADDTTVSYTFDGDGNITSRTDSTGTVSYAFDPLSRETVRTLQNGSQTVLAYTADGNVESYTDPAGTVEYAWDDAGRLTTLTDPDGNDTTYTYDNNDQRTETVYPHGLTQTATLDASGRPTRITAEADDTTLVDLAYTYALDAVDGAKIRTRTDELTGYVTSYDYDSAGRFSYAAERDGGEIVESWQYCYDPAGNLTSQGVSPGCPRGTTYTVNAASQITAKNGDSDGWSYDAAGNETAAAPTEATTRTDGQWSAFSQLTGVTVAGQEYAGEYASSDNSERVRLGDTHFHHGPLGLSATTTDEADTGFVREPGGTLNSFTRDGRSHYYITDAIGSVVAVIDEDGDRLNAYSYSPRGVTRTAHTTEEIDQPYRFAGEYQDATGLYHLSARYYDPRIGRFTQPDPSGQEKNPYLYAEGDPVNRIDPTGLWAAGAIGAVGDFLTLSDANSVVEDTLNGDLDAAVDGLASMAAGVAGQSACAFGAGLIAAPTAGVGGAVAAGVCVGAGLGAGILTSAALS